MSRGAGRIERGIGKLFCATKDRTLSISELAAYAFELPDGAVTDRKQRLSATRAAHRLLRRAEEVTAGPIRASEAAFDRVVAETEAKLGRPPERRRDRPHREFLVGRRDHVVDLKFCEAMWEQRERNS